MIDVRKRPLQAGLSTEAVDAIDATLRALLRSGAWELMKHPETPREVVIDEIVAMNDLGSSALQVGQPLLTPRYR